MTRPKDLNTKKLPASPCPKCRSTETVRHGRLRVWCLSCGRTSVIKPLERPKPDYNLRPPCPRCGARYAVKNGSIYDYVCVECGKYFNILEEF